MGKIFCVQCRTALDVRPDDRAAWREPPRPRAPFAGRRRAAWILWACAAGGMALAAWPRAPGADTAGGSEADAQQARKKLLRIEQGLSLAPQRLSQRELNAYLAERVRDLPPAAGAGWSAYAIRSAGLSVRPSAVTVSADARWGPMPMGSRRVGPWRLTHELTLVPRPGPTGTHWQIKGGRVGHLPLPGPFGRLAALGFRPLWRASERECALAASLSRVDLEEHQAVLAGPAPTRHTP